MPKSGDPLLSGPLEQFVNQRLIGLRLFRGEAAKLRQHKRGAMRIAISRLALLLFGRPTGRWRRRALMMRIVSVPLFNLRSVAQLSLSRELR